MKSSKGFTFVELLVTMALFVVGLSILVIGFRFLNDAMAQTSMVQTEQLIDRDFLYLTMDVKNAKSILLISSDTLRLSAFNMSMGFTNPQMFNQVNVGTITYRHALLNGRSALQRVSDFGGVPHTQWMLTSMVRAPTDTEHWFRPVGSSLHAVEVAFMLDVPFWKTAKEYRSKLIMLGQGQ